MSKQKRAALLVLNYNSKSFLKTCLHSLLKQTYKQFKIFVIDNCSNDGSVNFVQKYYPQIKIIKNSQNVGVGKAFNKAIKKVFKDFDYIGFLNPDIKVDKNWLKELVHTLDKNQQIKICASLILDWEGNKIDTAGGTISNFLAGIFEGFLSGKTTKQIPNQYRKAAFPVFFGVATAMLVRAATFEKSGLFDKDYFMYFEDIDFSWRVLLGGGKIYCNPKAIAYHFGHGTKKTKQIQLKIIGKLETNLLSTYFKNLSFISLILILPCLIFSRILGSFVYFFISPKITYSKLKGISRFLVKLFLGKDRKQRKFAQSLRKLNDYQVLSLNPGPLFSFSPLIGLPSWIKKIKEVYEKSKKIN